MPEMSGSDVFDMIRRSNPEIKVLLSSGYSLSGEAEEMLNRGCSGFIQKPFNLDQLASKIAEILRVAEKITSIPRRQQPFRARLEIIS